MSKNNNNNNNNNNTTTTNNINLIIKVVAARDLLAADVNGKSDPYVTLTLTSRKPVSTKVIDANLNPKWNETFEMVVEDETADELLVEVFDKDLFGKDKLGFINIPIRSLTPSLTPTANWYTLQNVRTGQIYLEILYKGVAGGRTTGNNRIPIRRNDNNHYLILALDGGGVRGLVSAQFLKRLEQALGAPLFNFFDLFAGTSVGSISAGELAVGGGGNDLLRMYEHDNISSIFPHSGLDRILSTAQTDPKYNGVGKGRFLEGLFGNKRMSETKKELIITSYNLRKRKFTLFSSSNKYSRVLISAASNASSAAPAYFPPIYVFSDGTPSKDYNKADAAAAYNSSSSSGGDWYIDGGVVNNNPSITAYTYAKAMWGDDISTSILSVGTGANASPIYGYEAQSWGGIQWLANGLIDVTMDESLAEYQANLLLDPSFSSSPSDSPRKSKYVRVNSKLLQAASSLDDISAKNIRALTELGDSWFDTFGPAAIQLVQQIYS